MLTEHIELPPCRSGAVFLQTNDDGAWSLAFWKVDSSGRGVRVKIGDVDTKTRGKAFNEMCLRLDVAEALES